MHTFSLTPEEIISYNIKNIEMGIADAKVEGHANAYAVNDNKITISQEIVIVLLIIILLIALWKFIQNYIKKQVVRNNVQNA